MIPDYKAIKNDLIPRRVVVDALRNKYVPSESVVSVDTIYPSLWGFARSLPVEQRFVLGLTAVEKCEGLIELVNDNAPSVAGAIYDWLNYRDSFIPVRSWLGERLSRVDFRVIGENNHRINAGIEALRCAYFALSADSVDSVVSGVICAGSAISRYRRMNGASAEAGRTILDKTIVEIVDHAVCRLSFADVYQADISVDPVPTGPRSGTFHFF